MKRAIALGLVASSVVLLLPTEASAATPAYDREWAVMPEVFVDEILFRIPKGEGQWRRWRQIRDYALDAYAPAGLDVQVAEQAAQERPTFQYQGTIFQDPGTVPAGQIVGTIAHPGTESYAMMNDPTAPDAGLMAIKSAWFQGFGGRQWRKGVGGRKLQLRVALAHELGHILGLDHGTDFSSVTTPYSFQLAPSPDDLQALMGPEVGLPDPGDPGYRDPLY